MNAQKNIIYLINVFKPKVSVRQYSVKGVGTVKGKKGAIKIEDKIELEVEKDTKKLVSEVCGTNLLAEGGENVKIKPDSEYPDWLWKLHFGAPLPLEKLDPSTKEYWYRIKEIRLKEEERILKYQKHKTLQK